LGCVWALQREVKMATIQIHGPITITVTKERLVTVEVSELQALSLLHMVERVEKPPAGIALDEYNIALQAALLLYAACRDDDHKLQFELRSKAMKLPVLVEPGHD